MRPSPFRKSKKYNEQNSANTKNLGFLYFIVNCCIKSETGKSPQANLTL